MKYLFQLSWVYPKIMHFINYIFELDSRILQKNSWITVNHMFNQKDLRETLCLKILLLVYSIQLL